MSLALAYRSCHLLGYSKKIIDDHHESNNSLESELSRRCFWACWISTCIVMDPEPYIQSAWQEAAMVPLPASISLTPSGYEINPREKMDQNWCTIVLPPRNGVIAPLTAEASLTKMVGVW